MTMASQFALFLLSSLVTCPSFMSISLLVLKLWTFSFTREWTEIRKSEIPSSGFCPTSGDWGELGIPNLAWMSLTTSYWMLQITRVTAFTVFELLRKNRKGLLKLTPQDCGLNPVTILSKDYGETCDSKFPWLEQLFLWMLYLTGIKFRGNKNLRFCE